MKEFKTTIYSDTIEGKLGLGVDYYKGETGKSGADEVYIGEEPPTDPQVKLWVDTEAQSVGAVDWNDVENKPNFATVATSGSYNDLTDKPVIPEAPDLTGYATESWVEGKGYTTMTEVEAKGYLTEHQDLSTYALKSEIPSLTGYAKTADLSTVATSGSYNDLTDKPVIPEAPDLTNYATKDDLANAKPDLTPYAKTADLSTVATSGSYEDLTNKPTIPDAYTLPTASTTTLGGVKVDGTTITIADGVISSAGGGGSVSVDGTSIIQNEDGTISTALKTTSNSITGANLVNLQPDNRITEYNGCHLWHSIVNTTGQINFQNTENIYNSILFTNGGGYSSSVYNSISYCLLMGARTHCHSQNSYEQHAFGMGQYVNTRGNQFVIGKANITDDKDGSTPSYYFIIGNGTNEYDNTRSNALTVDPTGNLAIAGTMSSAGADYAEFFEWKDGNPEAEDRVGYIVSLDGDKLILANEGDYILGVVSGTATVLGDNPEWNWAKRWVTDDFGRIQYEDKVIHHEAEERNGETILAWDETIKAPVVNPDYDPGQKYIKRADRPEWSAVGMMGKLYVRDDGTCQVNGYAKPINGVATASTSGTMRVIERVSDNVIRVVIK